MHSIIATMTLFWFSGGRFCIGEPVSRIRGRCRRYRDVSRYPYCHTRTLAARQRRLSRVEGAPDSLERSLEIGGKRCEVLFGRCQPGDDNVVGSRVGGGGSKRCEGGAQAAADTVAGDGIAYFAGDGEAKARAIYYRTVGGAALALKDEAIGGRPPASADALELGAFSKRGQF